MMLDESRLYAALLARDPAYEGRALVGVVTTGVFCRLTCPARKPLARNCRWFADAGAATAAGFRPCRRCRPTGPQAAGDPGVARLVAAIAADPTRRWSEGDVAARGLDPSTVRRAFRRHFGQTFLQYARAARLAQGVKAMGQGAAVIEAQLDAGFDSASGFRTAFARLFGAPPGAMRGGAADLRADWIETPLGGMVAVADEAALHLLEFPDRKGFARQVRGLPGRVALGRTAVTEAVDSQLAAFMAGRRAAFDLPLAFHGTAFQRAVWAALAAIPAGQTRSYAELAASIGRPTATRAVAAANAANRLAIVVPCHRVIGADGRLTGYAGGLWRKERLIEIERQYRAGRPDPAQG